MTDNRPLRVVIVDDHRLMREGLCGLMKDHLTIEWIGQFESGEALLEAGPISFDLALIDLALGHAMRGTEVIHLLANREPPPRCVLLTMFDDPQIEIEAREAGAAAYLLKDMSPEDFTAVIQQVMAGDVFIGPHIGSLEDQGKSVKRLSSRERLVLRELATGATAKEIAARLDLSVHTVDTYRRRLGEKLDARNVADLVRAASRLGVSV